MPTIGILERFDNVIYYSSNEIARYMTLVKYAVSFAKNIRDGRLYEINHTPFIQNAAIADDPEEHYMFVAARTITGKEEIILHFCLDYAASELHEKELGQNLLDFFIDKFFEKVKIRGKFIEKLEENKESFTQVCDEVFNETMVGYDLFTHEDAGFLLDNLDSDEHKLKLLFATISVQGLPIVAKFYSEMLDHFRFHSSEGEDAHAILENLISAQLSTLSYQSLIQGTNCNHILMRFSDFTTFEEREITINFFPINEDKNQEGFYFITMAEGDPELAGIFLRSVSPLIAQTGLLEEKFTGNVSKYQSLRSLMESFPRRL